MQGGVVELLKAGEKGQQLRGQGCVCVYLSSAKSYVVTLETHSAKVTLPAGDKPLALITPYLNLQIFIHPNKPFTLELTVTDISSTKRRLVFSSAVKINTVSLMHARILNDQFPRNIWVNLCIDVVSFMSRCFPSATFRSVDEITVFSFCRLKRVFGSRLPLAEGQDGINCVLPKSYDFNHGVDCTTVLIRAPAAPSSDPPLSKPPIASTLKPKPQTLTLDQARILRTASPQIQKRLTSSTSPAQRPQKSAPPHRVMSLKAGKTPVRPKGSSISPAKKGPSSAFQKPTPTKKHTINSSVSQPSDRGETAKELYKTTYSKFDSVATNFGDDGTSVQEEIEEEQKAADRSLAQLHADAAETHQTPSPLRKLSYLEAQLDQVTTTRPYSPPFTGLEKPTEARMDRTEDRDRQLIHDPVLKCFYDPKTQEFFEIDN